MLIFILIVVIIVTFVIVFIHQPNFGRLPSGERLQRIKNSSHYKNGQFQNLSNTPALTEGETYSKLLKMFLFSDRSQSKPKHPLPSVKTNLSGLDINDDVLVWFGHSSYYMQLDGKRILADPVLSGAASPLPGGTKAFKGADIYKPADIPPIDYLFISHDHWDHLDYKTVIALKERIHRVICPLGVGAHLEYWGFEKNRLIEKDWNEFIQLDNGFTVNTTPARHFSGRSFWRNRSAWMSFVLQTPHHKIFMGGDSGYDTHFAGIGKAFGPFDLAILENGQYNHSWKYIHMMPEEVLKAAGELRARKLLPVHSSKFNLSLHPWYEPLKRITALENTSGVQIITPMIGELVQLNNSSQEFTRWWEGVE